MYLRRQYSGIYFNYIHKKEDHFAMCLPVLICNETGAASVTLLSVVADGSLIAAMMLCAVWGTNIYIYILFGAV